MEINLSDLTRNAEVRNLSGHERGVAARQKFELDRLDAIDDPVIVTIPDYVYTITPSFFQGMFAESVRKAGGREHFLNRYRFRAPPIVLRQIDSGIESSLMKRTTIFNH